MPRILPHMFVTQKPAEATKVTAPRNTLLDSILQDLAKSANPKKSIPAILKKTSTPDTSASGIRRIDYYTPSPLRRNRLANGKAAHGGRPSTLLYPSPTDSTKTVFAVAVSYALNGVHLELAARAFGVAPETIKNWLRWGEEIILEVESGDKSPETLDDRDHLYYQFYKDYSGAHAQFTTAVAAGRARVALDGKRTSTTNFKWVEREVEVGGKIEKRLVRVKVSETLVVTDDPIGTDRWLENHYPDVYGVPKQIRLAGADGGELQVGAVLSNIDVKGLLSELPEDMQIRALEEYDKIVEREEAERDRRRLLNEKVVNVSNTGKENERGS